MKKVIFILTIAMLIGVGSCKKDNISGITDSGKQQVLTDFATVLVNPNYQDIQMHSDALRQAVAALVSSPTDANLATAQQAWRDTRAAWENCESYLFGPVEDNNYDPAMDTWPLDQVALDSLISSSNALTVSDIDALPDALKGFHAIEYMLFGNGGSRTASQLSARQLTYLQSLSVSLYNVTTALRNSWHPDHGNFTALLTTAGKGSTRFSTRKDAFLAITAAMSGICEEVANNKMETPLIGGPASSPDSSLSESRFSHNSTSDFTNNIKGVLNAYMTSYNGSSGQSLHTLVATTNISLDNKIRSQLNTAISSFSAINSNYEVAIYDQIVQIQNTQNAIRSVQSTIDNELTPFIQANIKD